MGRINKRRNYKFSDEGMMKMTFGTEDRMQPDVVHISGNVWVKFNGESECEKLLNGIRSSVKSEINEWLRVHDIFSNKIIFDFSIVTTNITKGVKKRLTVDVYLRRKCDKSLIEMRNCAESGIRPIMRRMLSKLERVGFEQCSGKKS